MFLAIAKLLINAGQKGIFTNANFRVGIEELLEQSVWPIRASKPTHKRLVTFRDSNEQSNWAQEWHLCVGRTLHYCHSPEAL
jgi:hypothetical protein